jgi:hypothetical protein
MQEVKALERYTLLPGRYEMGTLSDGPTEYMELESFRPVVVMGVRSKELDGWDQDSIQVIPTIIWNAMFPDGDPERSADGRDCEVPDEKISYWLEIPISTWGEVTA